MIKPLYKVKAACAKEGWNVYRLPDGKFVPLEIETVEKEIDSQIFMKIQDAEERRGLNLTDKMIQDIEESIDEMEILTVFDAESYPTSAKAWRELHRSLNL